MPLGSNTSGHLFDTSFTTDGVLYSAANGVITSTAAGNSGEVLTSNGAGVAPTFQSGPGLLQTTVNLTNAEIRALNTTPKILIPAQGLGTIIIPMFINFKFIYGGNNAFVAPGFAYTEYGNTPATNPFSQSNSSGYFQNTTTTYFLASVGGGTILPSTGCENLDFTFSVDTPITGNAANDNTAKFNVLYYVLSF